MEALGIPRGSYVMKVNNRKVLDGLLEAIDLGGEANAGKRLTVLRAIDKLDRLGSGGRTALLGKGAKTKVGISQGARVSACECKDRSGIMYAPSLRLRRTLSDRLCESAYSLDAAQLRIHWLNAKLQ